MANTYSQLNIQCVFAVKGRQNLLTSNFREDLFRYISGILKSDGAYPLAVNGYKDHVHVFFELPVHISVSKQMQLIKASSAKWINDNKLVQGKFSWQEGFGAFSYSHSQRDNVINYIINQEQHHKIQTFKEEYLAMLNNFNIKFDGHYLFDFIEE